MGGRPFRAHSQHKRQVLGRVGWRFGEWHSYHLVVVSRRREPELDSPITLARADEVIE
jgi:hypothetical protein